MQLHEIRAKVVLIGTEDSQKDALIARYARKFNLDFLKIMGVEVLTKEVFFENAVVKLNIWNVALPQEHGKEKLDAARIQFMQGAKALLFTFNLSNPDSKKNLLNHLSRLGNLVPNDIPIILIGNLTGRRAVPYEEIRAFADSQGMKYAEVADNMELILVSIGIIAQDKPLPRLYQNLFSQKYSDNITEFLTVASTSKECVELDKKQTIYDSQFNSIWSQVKSEELILIEQRLARLENSCQTFAADYQQLRPIYEYIGGTKEEFVHSFLNHNTFLDKWLENEPEKIEIVRAFLQDRCNLQQKYWKEIFNLKLGIVERKEEILRKFKESIDQMLDSTLLEQSKLKHLLEKETLPEKLAKELTKGGQIFDEIVAEKKKGKL